MTLRTLLTGTALAVAVGVAGPAGEAAHAAADTTPPRLVAPARATFVVGSAIGAMDLGGGDIEGVGATAGIRMRATYRGVDASRIAGYRTRDVYAGMEPDSWSALTRVRRAARTTTDYDDQFGGGTFKFSGIDVRARDRAGNRTDKFIAFRPQVFQDDGRSFGYTGVSATYAGAWRVSSCDCWSGGTARSSTTRGDRATFTVETSIGSQPVALVMETAANRGRARVFVDGVRVAVVDTYAATPRHRRVVWAGRLRGTGTHEVMVVNNGTPARPRVDVDAFLVSG